MLILNDFWKQKMDVLTLDKTFVLDNFNIVLDKKYFVQADGLGICGTQVQGQWEAVNSNSFQKHHKTLSFKKILQDFLFLVLAPQKCVSDWPLYLILLQTLRGKRKAYHNLWK